MKMKTTYTYNIQEPLLCDALYSIVSDVPLSNDELIQAMAEQGSDEVEWGNTDFDKEVLVECRKVTDDITEITNSAFMFEGR